MSTGFFFFGWASFWMPTRQVWVPVFRHITYLRQISSILAALTLVNAANETPDLEMLVYVRNRIRFQNAHLMKSNIRCLTWDAQCIWNIYSTIYTYGIMCKHNIIQARRVYKLNVCMIPGCPLKIINTWYANIYNSSTKN